MRVLVTHHIPDVGLAMLKEHSVELDILPEKKSTKKHVIAALKKTSYQGVVSLLTDTIDKEVIDAAAESGALVIANYAVGFNNIDIEYAKKKGIIVTNTPGVLTETVAEHTFALILAVATRIVEADTFVRKGKFTGWEPELLLGQDLKDKALGIIGAGRIGSRVAQMAKAIGMEILYFDTQKNEWLEKEVGAKMCIAPEDLLRESDVVSVHLPLNDGTHHFLNAQRIALMKTTAILVNTSRGPVIDEEALIAALERNLLFGAGLDVFEYEPKIPRKLRSLSNVILTPHTASASIATRNKMASIAAQNVIAVLFGGEAPNPVT